MARWFIFSGCLSGFLSVALGAFAAHGLKNSLDEYALKVFQTGVQYQFYHALALVLLGLVSLHSLQPSFKLSGIAFLFGTLVFSGSLYALALSGVKMWGAITPIGGVAFLIGWGCFAYGALSLNGALNLKG